MAIPKTGWVKEKEDEKAEKYQDYRKSTVQLVKTLKETVMHVANESILIFSIYESSLKSTL